MPSERFADVAIVGGGVMGASIAAHLVERKAGRVVVFEREDLLGTGSTAKAAGGVRLQFTTAANVALSRYSIEGDPELRGNAPGWTRTSCSTATCSC